MSLDLIKKKIQLYVSESGAQKSAKYYRIPTPSDSMEYSRENNAFKNCVRWYAKISGDRIYFSYITTYRRGVNSERTNLETSTAAIKPTIPSELLNDGEVLLEVNPIYNSGFSAPFNSDTGYSDITKELSVDGVATKTNLTKNRIFTNTSMVFSDSISDLSSAIPTTWVELENIDDVISDIQSWIGSGFDDTVDRGCEYDIDTLINSIDGDVEHKYVLDGTTLNLNGTSSLKFNRLGTHWGGGLILQIKSGRFREDTFTATFSRLTEKSYDKALAFIYKTQDDTNGIRTFSTEELKAGISIPNFSNYKMVAFKSYYKEVSFEMTVTSRVEGAFYYDILTERIHMPHVTYTPEEGVLTGEVGIDTKGENFAFMYKGVEIPLDNLEYKEGLTVNLSLRGRAIYAFNENRDADRLSLLKVYKDGRVEDVGQPLFNISYERVGFKTISNVEEIKSLYISYDMNNLDSYTLEYLNRTIDSYRTHNLQLVLTLTRSSEITFEQRKARENRETISLTEWGKKYDTTTKFAKFDLTALPNISDGIETLEIVGGTSGYVDLVDSEGNKIEGTYDSIKNNQELRNKVRFIYASGCTISVTATKSLSKKERELRDWNYYESSSKAILPSEDRGGSEIVNNIGYSYAMRDFSAIPNYRNLNVSLYANYYGDFDIAYKVNDDIVRKSMTAEEFKTFLKEHSEITKILFYEVPGRALYLLKDSE